MAKKSIVVPACPVCGSTQAGHSKDEHPFVVTSGPDDPLSVTIRVRGNSETERSRQFARAKADLKKHFPRKKLSFVPSQLETSQALTYASVISYIGTED